MALTPRKAEREAVRAVLESTDFDDADQMADAVIKLVAELLAGRDSWFLHWGPPGAPFVMSGPFWIRGDAERWAKKWPGTQARLHTLFGPSTREPAPLPDRTCECGHVAEMHAARWGCSVVSRRVKCECSGFEKKVTR